MVYKWYILPIGGLYATYHLLGEPETTIDVELPSGTPPMLNSSPLKNGGWKLTFPIGKVTVQGQAVKLREGSIFYFYVSLPECTL